MRKRLSVHRFKMMIIISLGGGGWEMGDGEQAGLFETQALEEGRTGNKAYLSSVSGV